MQNAAHYVQLTGTFCNQLTAATSIENTLKPSQPSQADAANGSLGCLPAGTCGAFPAPLRSSSVA